MTAGAAEAANLLASAALALLSKFRVTVWPCAPVTVADGIPCSPWQMQDHLGRSLALLHSPVIAHAMIVLSMATIY